MGVPSTLEKAKHFRHITIKFNNAANASPFALLTEIFHFTGD